MSQSQIDTDQAIADVISAGRIAASRHWIPATSGNFSVRVDESRIAITRSGVDKGHLSPEDILIQPLNAPLLPRSSAEAPLHVRLYQDHPGIGAVFHVHSHCATVLSQAYAGSEAIRLTGWELQKAFAGIMSHTTVVSVPLFANDQDTQELASRVAKRLTSPSSPGEDRAPGYLLSGHGLYAWGDTAKDAHRHLEAFETLFHQIMTLKAYQP